MPDDNRSGPASYLFGDTDLAAERLRLLAQVFEPPTREFLSSLAEHHPLQIADLGCGPGHTSQLLAELFPQASVLGIDSSAHFVALARQLATERVEFAVGDVSGTLAGGPFDLIYSRYLLTHVPRAVDVVASWGRHLRDGGAIAIEENAWIRTSQEPFARYLEIVAAMLAAGEQKLYVGAELAAVTHWPGLTLSRSEVLPVPATNAEAAGMFLRNIATWREQPFIKEHFTASEIDELAGQIDRLAVDSPTGTCIEFGRRRLVLTKRCQEPYSSS